MMNFNRGLWEGGVEYGWYKQLFKIAQSVMGQKTA